MSALDEIINVYAENVDDEEWVTNARAELAGLRDSLREAREIISTAKDDYQSDIQAGEDSYDKGERCINWLAAHPAPSHNSEMESGDDD